jgi:TonB family protein
MNKSRLTLLTTLLISFSSFGQESHYFTMYFQAKVTEKTPYLRKYVKSDGQISTEDFKNDKLEFSGTIIGTTDIIETDDFLGYIRTLGQESKYKETFKKYDGKFRFYHESGSLSNEVIYKRNTILYSQAWSEDGKEQLVNGTGLNKSSSDDYDEDSYEEYKDSLMIAHYSVRRVQKDTIYSKVDKQAEPKEGIQTFYQNLVKVLKYPVVARFVGKEGRVFIQFVVDENGKLTDFSPKTKEGYGLETKVVQKLEAFPNWKPAVFKGRFVKTRFVLPITYKLTD